MKLLKAREVGGAKVRAAWGLERKRKRRMGSGGAYLAQKSLFLKLQLVNFFLFEVKKN